MRGISAPMRVLQHSTAVRYAALAVLLLAVLYLVIDTQARRDAIPSQSTVEAGASSLTTQAPPEALFESKQTVQATPKSTNTNKTEVRATQTTGTAPKGASVDTKVTVNGKQVKLSGNGSVHKVIQSGSQKTTVDISSSSNSSSSTDSSLNVSVQSSSENSSGE